MRLNTVRIKAFLLMKKEDDDTVAIRVSSQGEYECFDSQLNAIEAWNALPDDIKEFYSIKEGTLAFEYLEQ